MRDNLKVELKLEVTNYVALRKLRETSPWSLKAYKLMLIHELCDGFSARMRGAKGLASGTVERIVTRNMKVGHDLVRFSGQKRGCVSCKRGGRRAESGRCVETSFGCSTCVVPLCKTGSCFNEFHGML